jgi:peptide/nickel transport system permease protein
LVQSLVNRLGATILVLLGASVIVFSMIHLAPGDPAQSMLGPMASPDQLQRLRVALGLDQPVYIQYWHWLTQALQGDLGQSIYYKAPVVGEIGARLWATAFLTICSFLFASIFGTLLGIIAAVFRGSLLDRLILLISTLGISFPPFYLGLLLVIVFSVHLQLLPMSGLNNISGESNFGDQLIHVILPSIALGAGPLTVIARMMRSSMLEELGKDYVRTARSKGLKMRAAIGKHAFRNALLPTIDLLGLQIGYLIASTALVEVIFTWPGIGNLLITSITNRDLPLTQGIVLLITVLYSVINLIADLTRAALDPRIRE